MAAPGSGDPQVDHKAYRPSELDLYRTYRHIYRTYKVTLYDIELRYVDMWWEAIGRLRSDLDGAMGVMRDNIRNMAERDVQLHDLEGVDISL